MIDIGAIEIMYTRVCFRCEYGSKNVACVCPKENPILVVRRLVAELQRLKSADVLHVVDQLQTEHYLQWTGRNRAFPQIGPDGIDGVRAFLLDKLRPPFNERTSIPWPLDARNL